MHLLMSDSMYTWQFKFIFVVAQRNPYDKANLAL